MEETSKPFSISKLYILGDFTESPVFEMYGQKLDIGNKTAAENLSSIFSLLPIALDRGKKGSPAPVKSV